MVGSPQVLRPDQGFLDRYVREGIISPYSPAVLNSRLTFHCSVRLLSHRSGVFFNKAMQPRSPGAGERSLALPSTPRMTNESTTEIGIHSVVLPAPHRSAESPSRHRGDTTGRLPHHARRGSWGAPRLSGATRAGYMACLRKEVEKIKVRGKQETARREEAGLKQERQAHFERKSDELAAQ